MNDDLIRKLALEAGFKQDLRGLYADRNPGNDLNLFPMVKRLVELVIAEDRQALLDTINELYGMETMHGTMFGEGYDYALSHITEFTLGRQA